MSDNWVVNASPVIVLSHINEVKLLNNLAAEVIIPEAVAIEINAGPEEDPARQALDKGHFKIVKTPEPKRELLAWDLGLAETAVLSYAMANPGWTAILDDAAARSCARSFGIPLKGTLGVILLARQKAVISSASDLLKELRAHGFYLNDDVIREALEKTSGEIWEP